MRFVSCELSLIVEFTINHDVDVVPELVSLEVAGDLEPARMRDCGENRQTVDYLIDMGFAVRGEEDDVTNNGGSGCAR